MSKIFSITRPRSLHPLLWLIAVLCLTQLVVSLYQNIAFFRNSNNQALSESKIESRVNPAQQAGLIRPLAQLLGEQNRPDVPGATLSLTGLSHHLKGIFLSQNPQGSYIIVQENDGRENMYQLNQHLPDGAVIKEITLNSIKIQTPHGDRVATLKSPDF